MTNAQISKKFEHLAAALTYLDQKKFFFQIRSYDKIAQVLRDLPEEVSEIYKRDQKLEHVEGVGPAISAKIIEILEKGYSEEMEDGIKKVPPAIFPLLDLPGVGVKRAAKLVSTFNITADDPVAQLKKFAMDHKIQELDGFGVKSEQDIIDAIERAANSRDSFTHEEAIEIANALLTELRKCPAITDALPLGSLRREKPKVRDIDLGVATTDFEEVKKYARKLPQVKEVIADGDNLIRLILQNNIQVDLKSSPPARWGAFLQHFTGSKEHNIKLREYALRRGLSLSEHGIKLIDQDKKLVEFDKEEDFYNYLQLKWIPPKERVGEEELVKYKLK
jgi:DNA polymerase (family X)